MDKYVCDNCKKTFTQDEIKQQDPIDNIVMHPMPGMNFVYMNDGKPMTGSEQPTKEKGDKILACPHCDFCHLFGFTKADEQVLRMDS